MSHSPSYTGNNVEQNVKLCKRAGCTNYLIKPKNRSFADFAKRHCCSRECLNLYRKQRQAAKVCPCRSGAPHYAKGLCWSCYSWTYQHKYVPPGTLHPQQIPKA